MDRRQLCAVLAAAALFPASATARVTRVPLADAFLLLADYLKLPAERRDRFHLAYLARRDGKPASGVAATYVLADGSRAAVAFAADGLVTNLPTLAQLTSRASFEVDGPALEFAFEMRATAEPAARVEVAALIETLAQASAAVAIFAEGQGGRLTDAYFPDAGGGQALFADGRAAPLATYDFPNLGAVPYLDLRRATGAHSVQLDRAPSRVLLGGPPHLS